MGGERAKPDAVRWNAEHDARMASMRVVWLVACPASGRLALRVLLASARRLKADRKRCARKEQNHVGAVRSATGSLSTERPIVPISASNSVWAPLAAPCALHEAGQASHTWLG